MQVLTRVLFFLFYFFFMLHVPLHITKVIDVGGVSLWVSSVCWDTNNHKPIMGYFGHGSGRLLN